MRGSGYWRQHQQQQRVKMRVYCDVSAVLATNKCVPTSTTTRSSGLRKRESLALFFVQEPTQHRSSERRVTRCQPLTSDVQQAQVGDQAVHDKHDRENEEVVRDHGIFHAEDRQLLLASTDALVRLCSERLRRVNCDVAQQARLCRRKGDLVRSKCRRQRSTCQTRCRPWSRRHT